MTRGKNGQGQAGDETKKFLVKEDEKVDLSKWPTRIEPVYRSKEDYRDLLAAHVARLSELQQKLYASNSHALLLIFQAMDAAGKDGCIRHVMSGVNPQGCQVTSFKHPSGAELGHDFLWRTTRALPERGQIGIFNRSYYEDVLILRVHPELLQPEGFEPGADHRKILERALPLDPRAGAAPCRRSRPCREVLPASLEGRTAQALSRPHRRAGEKLEIFPGRHEGAWFLDDYQRAYGQCLSATSTGDAPWHVVPADDKPTARLIVSQVILEKMDSLKLEFPEVSDARRAELQTIRGLLAT